MGERDDRRVVVLYTKGEINERWRNRTGKEKVMVGLAESKDLQTLLASLVCL